MSRDSNIALAARAFGKQAEVFDEINDRSVIISWMRSQVYAHVDELLSAQSSANILEINAGTGIDACYFARQGHYVWATDVSQEMLAQADAKIREQGLEDYVQTRKLSYTELDQLEGKKFDLIFSNFGGLNCIDDFNHVGPHFSTLIKPGGYICLVMINPFCLWETMLALKGNFKLAFRRFKKSAECTVEGIPFTTTYFSARAITRILEPDFRRRSLKSLATFTPPPYLENRFGTKKGFLRMTNQMDHYSQSWPFLRVCGDHFIITFQHIASQ